MSGSCGCWRRRKFCQTAGVEHGIELGSDEDDEGDKVHPDEQGDADAKRTVDDAVVDVVLQIPAEDRGGDQPHGGG